MKFELNDYHRNVSNEEFISDVIKTAEALNKTTLTTAEYAMHGRYHSSTLTRRFGSWKKVLELSGLNTKGHNFRFDFSDDDVIADVKRVAIIYKQDTITKKEYDAYGTYHSTTLAKRYGGWNNILKLAGMELNLNRNFTDEEMFEEIERVWILLGRQPTSTDITGGVSKFSLQSYARRFGGWRGALKAFVDYINSDFSNEELIGVDEEEQQSKIRGREGLTIGHKTKRDINLRLRFLVMKRDNFKCCVCGASPAKDPSIELHIDHIVPWVKGGETVMENLQTLCSKCNLGKSDIL